MTKWTLLGAAMLAGVGCGLFAGLEEAAAMRSEGETFEPTIDTAVRDKRLTEWQAAVHRLLT